MKIPQPAKERYIFGFTWTDPAPDQPDFERLMHRAAAAIDEWISGRM
ncbi:MAG: hypothetical protein WAW42_10915 [Candidatus Competibacteraceae bacterium]